MKSITSTWRAFLIATLAGTAGLVTAAAAAATPPTTDDLGVVPYEFSVDCGLYGFAFANNVVGQEALRFETSYDAAGNPVRVVLHDSFSETDTNSVSGETLRVTARAINTFDLVAGTRTVVGEEFKMIDPGSGDVIHDMGRVVFDAPFHVAFEAGRHEVLHGNADQLACTALAAD